MKLVLSNHIFSSSALQENLRFASTVVLRNVMVVNIIIISYHPIEISFILIFLCWNKLLSKIIFGLKNKKNKTHSQKYTASNILSWNSISIFSFTVVVACKISSVETIISVACTTDLRRFSDLLRFISFLSIQPPMIENLKILVDAQSDKFIPCFQPVEPCIS